jgi:biotin carboxylase
VSSDSTFPGHTEAKLGGNGPERPRVLLIGLDRYVLRACLRHNIDAVIVCGAAAYDYGLVEVPTELTLVRVDDQRDVEGILSALHRKGLGLLRYDGVQTQDERALVTASVLARHFGCRHLDPATALRFRDKSLQKQCVRQAGIPTADMHVIDDVHDVLGLTELPWPVAVLKPIAGSAARLTSRVCTIEELRGLSRQYRAESTSQRTFILEQYVEGEEWSADGIVSSGEVAFCALARYNEPCMSAVEQQSPFGTMRLDPERDREAYKLALPLVRGALEALGLRDGTFHMELFHDPASGRITFGECAARRGGAMINEELLAKFNVDLGEASLLCALGRFELQAVKNDPRFFGSSFLLGRPGVLVDCPSPAELVALPGVEFVRIERPFGTLVPRGVEGTNQRIGQFMVAADTREALVRRLAEVRAWFEERLVVSPYGATARDLRAWQRGAVPDRDFGDTAWT